MRTIVVAAANQKFSSAIEDILTQNAIVVDFFCKSGSEVISLQNQLSDPVLVCGTLKDIPSIYLARELPNEWDVILLLKSNQPFPYYVSNITPINLPVNRLEFVETVRTVAQQLSQTYAAKTTAKKVRSPDEEKLIEDAKRLIMKRRSLSESDAHRLLQRYSMNLGISMLELAKRFLCQETFE